jgi:hypothetical protein
MTAPFAHMVTQQVLAPAEFAFAYLSDPIKLGRWSLGCFDTEPTEVPGLYTGVSLFDSGRGWFRIEAEASRLAIDYLVGEPQALVRRISARIIQGPEIGYEAETCLVSLIAWRPASMPDERWNRLRATHEAEIFLVKAQIERARE